MRPVWAEINLSAIKHNVQEVRRIIPEHTRIMAVIKANAYGHGAVPAAEAVLAAGADCLAVAILEEALELRRNGIQAPILVLGYTPAEGYPEVVKNEITQTIYTYEQALKLSEAAAAAGRPARVQIKIDTGMGRIGFTPDDESVMAIKGIAELPLEIEGLFTHLANADAADKTHSLLQLDRFSRFCKKVAAAGVPVKYRHAAGSAAVIDLPEAHLDLVRPGLMLYGLYPSQEIDRSKVRLQPAMALKTRIIHLKRVEAGTTISYGSTFTTAETSLIATLPLGYADGYSRLLSNRGTVLVRECRAPVVGRVCMDQCMLDVTAVPGVAPGDEVVLFGRQGKAVISAEEVADQAQTISHEIVSRISSRVPRVYL